MKQFKRNIMSKSNLLATSLVILFTSFSITAQESKWTIDPSHSAISFDISYFKVGTIKGVFDSYSGSFMEENEVLTTVNITIETASINTNQKDRDKHLRSRDFFDAESYSEINFKSTTIKKTGDKTYEIKGDFTMSGITKSVVLKGIDKGSFIHPRFKTNNRFISVTGSINRDDFKVGSNYPPAKMALGSEVQLNAEIHLIQDK